MSTTLLTMIIKVWSTDQAYDEIAQRHEDEKHPASCDCVNTQGFMYSIYDTEDIDDDTEDDDGGLCTGTEADAIEMACQQALELIANRPTCPHCKGPMSDCARGCTGLSPNC